MKFSRLDIYIEHPHERGSTPDHTFEDRIVVYADAGMITALVEDREVASAQFTENTNILIDDGWMGFTGLLPATPDVEEDLKVLWELTP